MKILKNIIFKNYTSLTVNHGINIFIHLVFVPLFLTFWNLDIYADWILISTIPGLLSISQFGLTAYGSNLIVIAYKQNKKNKANFVFQNIFYFVSVFIFSLCLILLLLNYIFDFQKIFDVSSIKKNEFYLVIIFVALKYLLLSNSNFLSGLFRINHKFHLSVYIQSTFLVTELILIAFTLFLGGQILEVSFVSFINYIIALMVSYFLIKREFIWFQIINFKNINFSFIKKIFYPSISFMTGSSSKAILIQGTIIFLNLFSNDILLVLYNSIRLILNGSRQFINILTFSFQPEITIDYAKKKFEKISHKFKFLLKYNFYISSIIAVVLVLFLKVPFLVWTKGNVIWNFNFFIFFLVASYIDWLVIPMVAIPQSINKIEMLNKAFIFTLVIYFVILISLFKLHAIISVPIALAIANLYFYFYAWIVIKKILSLKKSKINLF